MRRCLLVTMVTLFAFVGEAAADEPEIKGHWTLRSEQGETIATMKMQGTDLLGTIVDATNPSREGKILLKGTFTNNSFRGELLLQPAREDASAPDTYTTLELTFDPVASEFRGRYRDQRYKGGKWNDQNRWADATIVPACRPIKGGIPLGTGSLRLRIDLPEGKALEPEDPEKDVLHREGECHYSAVGVGSIRIETGDADGGGGAFSVNLAVPDCDLEIYMEEGGDPRDPKAYTLVNVFWTDDERRSVEVFNRWGISFFLYALDISLDVAEDGSVSFASAGIEVQMDVTRDVHLGGPVYLGGNLSGTIRYEWTPGATSWTQGNWYFDALGAVQLQVRQSGSVPIATLDLKLDPSGEIEARMQVKPGRKWRMAGFELEMIESSLQVRISLKDGTWEILSGSLTGKISAEAPVAGTVDFRLSYTGKVFEFEVVGGTDLSVCGVECRDLRIKAVVDPETLAFESLEGAVKLKHKQFGSEIEIADFALEQGRLTRFVGAGSVVFEKAFQIDIGEIRYDAGVSPAQLSVRASLALQWSKVGAASVDIKDFTIDLNGKVSRFRIEARVGATPVEITLNAAYETGEFKGEFNGSFIGTVRIGGKVVVGNRGFNYGYLRIAVNVATGFPIGQTGLKLTGLEGAFGFNWLPEGVPSDVGAPGPNIGKYYFEAGITVADLADVIEITGRISLSLGEKNSVGISGDVRIPRNSPYFRGKLKVDYVIGSTKIDGSVTATVKLPMSGAVIDIEENKVDFGIGAAGWYLSGRNLGGTLLGILTVSDGTITVRGSLDRPIDTLRGDFGARLRASTSASFAADWWVFGIRGGVSVALDGRAAGVALDKAGITGTVRLDAKLAGDCSITMDTWWGKKSLSGWINASGQVTGEKHRDGLHVDGTVTVSGPYGISFDKQFQHDF